MNIIIKTLKEHPNLSIRDVSILLGMSESQVANAQRDYYKKFIPIRSELWNLPLFGR